MRFLNAQNQIHKIIISVTLKNKELPSSVSKDGAGRSPTDALGDPKTPGDPPVSVSPRHSPSSPLTAKQAPGPAGTRFRGYAGRERGPDGPRFSRPFPAPSAAFRTPAPRRKAPLASHNGAAGRGGEAKGRREGNHEEGGGGGGPGGGSGPGGGPRRRRRRRRTLTGLGRKPACSRGEQQQERERSLAQASEPLPLPPPAPLLLPLVAPATAERPAPSPRQRAPAGQRGDRAQAHSGQSAAFPSSGLSPSADSDPCCNFGGKTPRTTNHCAKPGKRSTVSKLNQEQEPQESGSQNLD
ncbi:uncharacterized protein [Notamacropus eugenii]|uniref:uncharacterized protein n=1 Tax=Notamacropus eugenii TaxID=9315 RepID=UPI003B67A4A1